MSESWLDNKPNCTLEFRVYDPERFQLLQRFFGNLKEWTQNLNTETNASQSPIGDTAVSRPMAARPSDDTQEALKVSAEDDTRQRRNFSKPEEWLLALRPQDLDALGMPDHPEAIRALREWHGMSRRERRKITRGNRDLQTLADFADMLRHWQDVEFELITCEMVERDTARIEYSTFDFPFQGKVALEEFLLFFGFFSITRDSC